ncbi:PfaB family protein [Kibdelosporangium banguiense]|uniref:PfaB family protein n=2 Tax=Kibdelosporangium banguiense TaxID=1365924 RepID=A0ABS4TG88_9PSEU|nr:PfaB family protein [Kibdelosporangium banguiense]
MGLGFGPAADGGGASVPLRLHVYSGKDRHDILMALAAGQESGQGPARLVILAAGAAEHAARVAAARKWLTGSGRPPEGVAFRETPIKGEVAFVFTSGAAAYQGMGKELMLEFPEIMAALEARCGPLDPVGWAYTDTKVDSVDALDQIWAAGLLAQLHTEINWGLLGISPDAIIGYSSGESNALVAMGAWRDVPDLVTDARGSVLFTSGLVGEFEAVRRVWRRLGVDGDRWMNYIVNGPVEDVRVALDGEPAVHLMAINAPDSCVVGGEAAGCERVVRRLGPGRALPLNYEIAVHAPELNEIREQWWHLHHRPTFEVPDVRFYSCATADWYSPTPEAAADALTAQAVSTVDFAATVERAWADGVRVFIEHGPQALCTGWIRRILGDREHLAVAMDGRGVHHLAGTVAELVAAGVPMRTDPLFDHLARNRAPAVESAAPQMMPPAPSRPRVSAEAPTAAIPATAHPRTAVTAVGDIYRRISARHQEFLTRQAEVHQRFLLSQRSTSVVHHGTGNTGHIGPTGRRDAGADQPGHGERFCRLLSAELTFHGSPPLLGEELRGETRVDGYGDHNGVRLSFFHGTWYVGDEPRMTAHDCVAGFFTEKELAALGGVQWDPAAESPGASEPVDPPAVVCSVRRFGPDAVRAFVDGQPADCFGPGWERTRCHIRSPRISDGRMLLNEVTEFDPAGGPWRRGYLRAETPVSQGDWLFEAQFTDDPFMPGSLMFDGCLQALAFYLAAMGYTVDRDGWRFEPVPDHAYHVRNRGRVTPDSRGLTYEVFVREVAAGPQPTLFADVLCTVDGTRMFYGRRLGLRLVPDWPLSYWRPLGPPAVLTTGEPVAPAELGGLRGYHETKPVAEVDGFRFDYAALLALAWGKPSEAFGPAYEVFDGPRRITRMPGPPYGFMSRVAWVDGPFLGMKVGTRAEVEYDVPEEIWYFEQNGCPAMPFAVLLEVVLQACGWVGLYAGVALAGGDTDLLIRNLDGTGTVTGEIRPGTRTLRTRAELTRVSQVAGVVIMSFDIECFADGQSVFQLSSGFGYFAPKAFDNQVGLPPSDAERARLAAPCDRVVDLTRRPARYFDGSLRLAGPMLLMLDRITGYWPDGGEAGLGRLRAEKDIDPGDWFFKAHFFQDPVQPGSLGVEGMCQLLQFYLIERGLGAGLRNPRFEPVLPGRQVTWKYRGQVVPTNKRVTVEMDIIEVDEHDRHAVGHAWLWVDGIRIYHVKNLGMRVVEGATGGPVSRSAEHVLDPAVDKWLLDHCPTFTFPALPMMSTVDLLAGAAVGHTGRPVTAVRDVQLRRWVPIREAVRLRTEVSGSGDELDVTLLVWRDAATPALSRFEPVASATVRVGGQPAGSRAAPGPLAGAEPAGDPYCTGVVFHGPSFQYLVSWRLGIGGASGVLDAGRGSVPRGILNQGLLDAATHVIPHAQLWRWSDEIGRDVVGFPHKITAFESFAPLPDSGNVYVEARFVGFDQGNRTRPVVDLWLSDERRLLATIRLVDILMPGGRLGIAEPGVRRAFLRHRRYAGGLGISVKDADVTRLSVADVEQFDWLGGTIAHVYGLPAGSRGRDHLARIAMQDHVARLARVHPSAVEVALREHRAWPKARPDEIHHLHVEQAADHVTVHSLVPPT